MGKTTALIICSEVQGSRTKVGAGLEQFQGVLLVEQEGVAG